MIWPTERSCKQLRALPSTPSPYGTAPVGHWGAFSPDPLRRYALRALCLQPPVPTGQPRWGTGERSPRTPCVATRCARFAFNPQSLRDSPGGALGSVLPGPLASLRAARALPSTPSPYGTAPVGHWGAFSPDPLRRYALRALCLQPPVPTGQPRWGTGERSPRTPCVATRCARFAFNPQSLRDSPGGALGSVLPGPLASLRSDGAIDKRSAKKIVVGVFRVPF